MFIKDAFAQGSASVSGSALGGTFIQIGLIFLIFYVLVILPQQKKVRQHDAMLKALKKGDKVVTSGGIIGKIVNTVNEGDAELSVEIAPNTVVKVSRLTIRELISDKPVPANSNKK